MNSFYSRGENSSSFRGGRGRVSFNKGGHQNRDWKEQPNNLRKMNLVTNNGKVYAL